MNDRKKTKAQRQKAVAGPGVRSGHKGLTGTWQKKSTKFVQNFPSSL
jgi:hypothetical protein